MSQNFSLSDRSRLTLAFCPDLSVKRIRIIAGSAVNVYDVYILLFSRKTLAQGRLIVCDKQGKGNIPVVHAEGKPTEFEKKERKEKLTYRNDP